MAVAVFTKSPDAAVENDQLAVPVGASGKVPVSRVMSASVIPRSGSLMLTVSRWVSPVLVTVKQ